MLRHLYHDQPEGFAFTPANREWAEAQISKYPEGRQASAIIPLLWRAQEQEGWLSRPAIEHVADMLGLAHIRALEVATFYFMFQLQPTGRVAHVQICGTTSCMICGAEDLIRVCREKIAPKPHVVSADGKLSWEEVECLGACSNAPMAQIGKDYYEDLTAGRLGEIIDALAAGEVPAPGPQNGRFASEPAGELTSLADRGERLAANASVTLAREIGDTIKRIDGTEVPLRTPWRPAEVEPTPEPELHAPEPSSKPGPEPTPGPRPSEEAPVDETGVTKQEAQAEEAGHPQAAGPAAAASGEDRHEAATGHDVELEHDQASQQDARPAEGEAAAARSEAPEEEPPGRPPERLDAPREGQGDDLTRLRGIGPQLQRALNEMGIWHIDQIARWDDEAVAWIEAHLSGPGGRVRRDDWVGQARELVDGGPEKA